jgi:transcriptional regulator with XRE-family HTH domain
MLWTTPKQVASVLQAMAAAKSQESERIGRLITALRLQKGWSQETLAQKVPTSVSTISRWERGIHRGYADNVGRLAKALEADPAILTPKTELELTSQLDQIEREISDLRAEMDGLADAIVERLAARISTTAQQATQESPATPDAADHPLAT